MIHFPKYDRYKDSGVEWLGEVPEHWEIAPFQGLFDMSPEKNGKQVVGSMLSISGYRGVEVKRYESDSQKRTEEQLSDYRVVRKNQLAVNTMWLNYAGLGVSEHEGHMSPAYRAYDIRPQLQPRFAHHLLRSSIYVEAYTGLMQGIRPNSMQIKNEDFKKIPVVVPPKSEQDRIVAFLDQKTAEIDALIAKKQRQIELLNEQKAILINRAVTRGLNPNAKLKPSGIEWIGDIPEHWEVKKLRWLLKSSVKNGVSPPISEKGQVPTLSIAAVKNGQVTFGENVKFTAIHKSEAASYLLREGDILALRGNGSRHLVATAGIVGPDLPHGCIYPDLLIRIQPAIQIASQYLVMQLNGVLRDGIYLTAKTSAGIWKVSGESLSALQVLLPPHDEQMGILDYANSVQERTAVCKSGFAREIQSLQTLRSSLIAHTVTGRIQV